MRLSVRILFALAAAAMGDGQTASMTLEEAETMAQAVLDRWTPAPGDECSVHTGDEAERCKPPRALRGSALMLLLQRTP